LTSRKVLNLVLAFLIVNMEISWFSWKLFYLKKVSDEWSSVIWLRLMSFVLYELISTCILYQVGRAGRFGTKGLAITFVASASDSDVLNQVNFSSRCYKTGWKLFLDQYCYLFPLIPLFHLTWVCYLCQVQERFEVDIKELPEQIDTTTYSENLIPCISIFCILLLRRLLSTCALKRQAL
jgi:hypothetical protein